MQKNIQASLHKALILNGPMSWELYAHELREHVAHWRKGMRRDSDELLVAVTERDGNVAMLLITKKGDFFMNEEARARLQKVWKASGVYLGNMLLMIPTMVQQLEQGEIWVTGIKTKR